MSRLNYLLVLNATSSKLTKAEETELQELVFSAKETETDCLICGETAIGDVRLCRGHAIYCWATKK